MVWIVRKNSSATWPIAQRDFVSDQRQLFTTEFQNAERLRPPPRPSLSQRDVSVNLERLLGCACVKAEETGHLLFYGLSAPRLLQLEGIADEMLIAALKGHRASLNYD